MGLDVNALSNQIEERKKREMEEREYNAAMGEWVNEDCFCVCACKSIYIYREEWTRELFYIYFISTS